MARKSSVLLSEEKARVKMKIVTIPFVSFAGFVEYDALCCRNLLVTVFQLAGRIATALSIRAVTIA